MSYITSTYCPIIHHLQLHNSKEVVHLLQRHVDTYGWTGSYESPEVYGHRAYSQNVGVLRLDALSSAGWVEKISGAVGVLWGWLDGWIFRPFFGGQQLCKFVAMFLLFNKSMLRRFLFLVSFFRLNKNTFGSMYGQICGYLARMVQSWKHGEITSMSKWISPHISSPGSKYRRIAPQPPNQVILNESDLQETFFTYAGLVSPFVLSIFAPPSTDPVRWTLNRPFALWWSSPIRSTWQFSRICRFRPLSYRIWECVVADAQAESLYLWNSFASNIMWEEMNVMAVVECGLCASG